MQSTQHMHAMAAPPFDAPSARRDLAGTERRGAARRICRVAAVVEVAGGVFMRGRTVDVSPAGVALLLPRALAAGSACRVSFTLYLDGGPQYISAEAEVSNSVFLSTSVRVGCRFRVLDQHARHVLAAFVR